MSKFIAGFFTVLLINLSFANFVAAANRKADDSIDKTKAKVAKINAKDKKKIAVKMTNGTKVKGTLSNISGDSFDVTEKSGNVVSVKFADVKSVSEDGLSATSKVLVGVGIGAAAALAILFLAINKAYAGE